LEKIKLTARARTGSGKSYTRKARAAGWIPAAFYGFGIDPLTVEVDSKEFVQVFAKKQQNKLVELSGEGIPADTVAVIREWDRDPIKDDTFYHIDFQNVDEARPVKTRAYLKLTGSSKAVKLGGILNQTAYQLDITGLVNTIPEALEIDITDLDVGETIMAGDLTLPEGVSLITSTALVVARVFGKKVNEEEE
jgi:large subunit ribosomal protein L25